MKTDDWTQLLTDAIYVQRIYSHPPDLSKVSIYEVVLDREASKLGLRFDIGDYPDRPPEKWIASQFNCAHFTIHVVGISMLRISGWSHEMVGSLEIEKVDSGVRVVFSNGQVSIECEGAFLSLAKIAGFNCQR